MKLATKMSLVCALAAFAFGPAPVMAQEEAQGEVQEEAQGEAQREAQAERPNILVVLIDDAAFMDLEPYGGEARTPHINALSARGTMFTQFRASPLCSPTRAMLLTGLDNHQTGLATIEEVIPPELVGQPGYSMHLEPGVTTIATRLSGAGYRTYMTGKWHLGHGGNNLPADHGFDRSFILDASGADNWEDKTFMPFYSEADWFEDREEASLPEDFYSSRFLVDRMIGYLEEDSARDEPFFAYIGFLAIHIPIQAPREYTDRYDGTYTEGWEALRLARWERAQALGLLPAGAPLEPFPDTVRAWDSLTDDERALYARSMAVNAGMLEAMDAHLGRLFAYLEETGELENTIVVVASDNGPEYNHPGGEPGFGIFMARNGYTWELENLGERGSMAFIGTEWALAASSPFSHFKFHTTEGGVRVPFIIGGPGISEGAMTHARGFMPDVAPTLLDLAGVPYDADEFFGRSLGGVVRGDAGEAYGPEDAIGMEVAGNAALYRGDWKLVRNYRPWGTGEWQLFNLATDPGETADVFGAYPEIAASMLAAYDAYAEDVGVLPLPPGYHPNDQLRVNTRARNLQRLGPLLMAAALGLLLLAAAAVFMWRRR